MVRNDETDDTRVLTDRDGRPILRVGFQTRIGDGTDRPPRMCRPRWLIADSTADDLHRQISRR